MNSKLKELDSKLNQLLQERFPNVVEVFNLGVDVGRELQLNNIADYQLPSLTAKEEASRKWQELLELNERIENLLKKLIVFCIDAYIKEHNGGYFEIEKRGSGYSDCDRWSEEIAKLFGVSYSHADMETYGGEFEMELSTAGWLNELNEKYNLPTTFNATFSNDSGEEYAYIGNKERAESGIWSVSTMNNYVFTNMTIEKIEQYVQELEQQVIFLSLKYD